VSAKIHVEVIAREIAHHGWNELRDCRMDVHRARCITVQGAFAYMTSRMQMNDFVARKSEQRRAEDVLRLLVDQNLHETFGFAFFI
jgi:2-oxoglutarate dehydrogenase complex dehydrogenase (E1) component-like enzyme